MVVEVRDEEMVYDVLLFRKPYVVYARMAEMVVIRRAGGLEHGVLRCLARVWEGVEEKHAWRVNGISYR